jgi:hypothetical protein
LLARLFLPGFETNSLNALDRLSSLTIAQLSERLRCAECGGQVQSVKPWRMEDVIGKPVGAARLKKERQ